MSKFKTTLSKNELVRTVTTLRNQLNEWRQATINVTADLLIVDPKNHLFYGDYLAESTMKQVISFAAERLDYFAKELYESRFIIDTRILKKEGDKDPERQVNEVVLNDLISLFTPFRTLQMKFKEFVGDRIASVEGRELMDKLDIEIDKLYTHFTGKQPAPKETKPTK